MSNLLSKILLGVLILLLTISGVIAIATFTKSLDWDGSYAMSDVVLDEMSDEERAEIKSLMKAEEGTQWGIIMGKLNENHAKWLGLLDEHLEEPLQKMQELEVELSDYNQEKNILIKKKEKLVRQEESEAVNEQIADMDKEIKALDEKRMPLLQKQKRIEVDNAAELTLKRALVANHWMDRSLRWTYFLLIVSVIATLLFAIYLFVINTIYNPKSAIKTVAALGVFVLLFVIAGSFSDSLPLNLADGTTFTEQVHELGFMSVKVLKHTGTGLFAMYFLVGLAILGIVVTAVVDLVKRAL